MWVQCMISVWVQFMICLLEGILVSTVFYCLRADLWFCWGFLTFLCNWVRSTALLSLLSLMHLVARCPTLAP